MSDVTDAQREIAGIVAQRKETRMTQKRSADITIPAPMARPDCSAESDPATLTFEAEDLGAEIKRLREETSNASQPIWELVIADMRERDRVGRARYGTPLQANNGRDPLIDAYQEALDLAVYLRQAIAERASSAAAAEALDSATPAAEWRDGQASAGPLNLSVWAYGGGLGGFGWAVSLAGDDIAACHWRHPLPTLDAAKAAAIAAARAWRDSIRL